ncbi:glycosyltransferase family 4 protein [Paenibacillus sp. 1_12]|uniref:glycosyltransferase family 4 protein n=1 Tax=Paenibacillus sp. 1_12 TaxID=1566278 RepID=UPI0021086145|nr:glycosyltransferase [Paenibacillus sp. 1_12]
MKRRNKLKRRSKRRAIRRKKWKLSRKNSKFKNKRRKARRKKRSPVPSQAAVVEATPPAAAPTDGPGNAPGINLIGFIHAEIGLGESARLAARAIQTTDIPFGIIDFPLNVANRMDDMTWAHKEIQHPAFNTNILHMNGDSLLHAQMHFGEGLFQGRHNIGFWHWELPDFPDENLPGFDLVNEVWVPTSFVHESVSKKSPVPVIRIPHGIHVEVSPEINRNTFGLPDNQFLFYMMYDVQSHTARKNPQAVIEAFKLAFEMNNPNVGLVLKINNMSFQPSDLEGLRELVSGHSNIYIIDRILSRVEVNSLLQCTDCFVSLHRSEGFGLGLAEAMYLGKPVVATNWSGNTDFMNPTNSCPVNYQLVQVGQDWGPYKAYQTWAEPDVHHAAQLMHNLVNNAEWRQSIAANGQQTIRNEYSPQVVGKMIKERLRNLGLI